MRRPSSSFGREDGLDVGLVEVPAHSGGFLELGSRDVVADAAVGGDPIEVDADLEVRDGLPEDADEVDDVLELGEAFDEGVEGALGVDQDDLSD